MRSRGTAARRRAMLIGLLCLLAGACLAALPAWAGRPAGGALLHLRRATFDPLRRGVAAPEPPAWPGLAIVQFAAAPGARERAALAAAGLRPLLYIPDNAFLVRAGGDLPAALAGLPGLRWAGPFQRAYKLAPDLDGTAPGDRPLDLRLLAAPDADLAALARDMRGLGAAIVSISPAAGGATLRARLGAAALRVLLARDDVLWVEPARAPRLHNDRAGVILGVPAARAQLGLTGAGQIAAVTDTGLDDQTNLSADFAGRIAATFTTGDMSATCAGGDWSDRNGHGTHVAGTLLGGGALSPAGLSLGGVAPQARLVVEAVSSGGAALDCLPDDTSYLAKAHDIGARVQNASWGAPTGVGSCSLGCYTDRDRGIDSYLWEHPDHLLVVSAGNGGADLDGDGRVDPDSISSPGTAKNVLTVGASESERASGGYNPGGACATWGDCFGYPAAPIAADRLSDNPAGIAAFSGRGPTADGRIKPEIVAPGTNILSARSHFPGVAGAGWGAYNRDYMYSGGTSSSAPLISGMAVLLRQWLAERRGIGAPSAALLKALLLNGAADLAPGQYGAGAAAEIPARWPNGVEGWGRATMTDTLGLGGSPQIWMRERAGIQTGESASYTLAISAGQELRVTLAWTDAPGSPLLSKQLVDDLDLELQLPDGAWLRGNAGADLGPGCRDVAGADRCDNVECVRVAAPADGRYVVRVTGAVVPYGPQSFALVARAARVAEPPPRQLFMPLLSR